MLEKMKDGKEEREAQIRSNGYPAYTTQAGTFNFIVIQK